MTYSVKKYGATAVIHVDEVRATVSKNASQLDLEIQDILGADIACIVVDFGPVKIADSSMLGVLVSGLKTATRKRRSLRIAGLNQSILQTFKLTRLDRFFVVYSTVEDALADCG